MSETVNTSEPAPMNSGALPLAETEGVNHRTHEIHGSETWRERLMAAMDALIERDLKSCELRAVWAILMCSVGSGRETTEPITLRALATRASLTTASVCRALKGLKAKRIIRRNADGSWQFIPESKFHIWLVPKRMDEAQGVKTRDQGSKVGGQPGNGESKNGDGKQQTEDEMNMKEQNTDDHGTHETHGSDGGNGDFLPPDVARLAKPATDAPLKSSAPSPKTPFNTIHNLLKGEEPVVNSATQPEAEPIEGNGTEAGMEMGSPIPEDPMDASEDTLMRRLMGLLGKETMKTKGGNLRLFIRGSLEAADCPDTAIAMRDAINDTEAAQREGRIKKSVFGYLYRQAFYWAGQMGWRFNAAKKEWTKGEKFNNWKHLNANRRRK